MTKYKDDELIHGSGNVFRDFGDPDADVLQLKCILAAQIIGVLDDQKLTTRAAQKLTRINHADFTRIRKVNLKRFSAEYLIGILNKLDQSVEVQVTVRPQAAGEHEGVPVPG